MKTVGPRTTPLGVKSDAALPNTTAVGATTTVAKTAATGATTAPPPPSHKAKKSDPTAGLPPAGTAALTSAGLEKAGATLTSIASATSDPALAELFGKAASAAADVAKMAKVGTPLRLTIKEDKSRPASIEAFLDRSVTGSNDAPRAKVMISPADRSVRPFPIDAALVEGLRSGARIELVLEKAADGTQTYAVKADDSAFAATFAANVVVEGGQAFAVGLALNPVFGKVPLPGGEALAGKTVLVDVAHPETPSLRSGAVREVVGDVGGLSSKLMEAAIREGVTVGHSAAAMAEVEALLKDPPITGKDLTHLPFITIDNVGSKDLDQAMCIQKRPDGGFDVHYAIADVAHFIPINSALDREARRRTQTAYLADGHNIPMLPRELSDGLISLLPDQKRRAFVVTVKLDADGNVQSRSFERGVIQSQKQLAYSQVQAWFDGGKGGELAGQPWSQNLELLRELGEKRVAMAVKRGVVPSDDGSAHLGVDKNGKPVPKRETRNQVEKWNEQISLLANEQVGKELRESGVRALFRTHPTPPADKVEAFRDLVGALGVPWPEGLPLADFVRGLDPKHPLSMIISSSCSMVNEPATYETKYSGGHSGLALTDYVHFTAPMRRYTDVVVARILAALVEKTKVPYQKPNDRTLDQVQNLTVEARRREGNLTGREGTVLAAAWFADKLNVPVAGRIVSVRPSGAKVELGPERLVFTVPVSALAGGVPGSTGALEAKGSQLVVNGKAFRIGDAMTVAATGIDAGSGRVAFAVVPS